MVNEQLAGFPDPSVTVYVIVVTPFKKTLPGPEPVLTGVKDLQLSDPVVGSVQETGFPQPPNAVVVTMLAGQEIVGN